MGLFNSIKIFFHNASMVVKTLVYKAFVAVCILACLSTFTYVPIRNLVNLGIFDVFKNIVPNSLVSIISNLDDFVINFFTIVGGNFVSFGYPLLIAVGLFAFVGFPLIKLDDYVLTYMLDNRLSSNYKLSFIKTLATKWWEALRVSLLKNFIAIFIDILFIYGIIKIISASLLNNNIIDFVPYLLAILTFVVLVVKQILLGLILASVANERKVLKGLSFGLWLSLKSSLKFILPTAVICLLIVLMNAFAVFYTNFFGLILTLPISIVLILCHNSVNYYEAHKNRYYIDTQSIHTPKKKFHSKDFKQIIDLV